MAWQFPKECPSCSTPLVRDGAHFFCPNHSGCKEQIYARLRHAFAKGALDLDGMGEVQIRQLMDECGVRQLSDVLSLTEAQVNSVLKPAAAKKFLAERQRIFNVPLWRKIYALGIEGIGQTSSKELCGSYTSLLAMVDAGSQAISRLLGPVATKNFAAYIEANGDEIYKLDVLGFKFEETAQAPLGGPLSGKTFVLTGAMVSGTRPEVAAKIEAAGGKVMGGVNKKTQYLVVGAEGGANKAAAARKLGTTCIDEATLYQMMGEEMPVAPGVDLSEA